MTRKLPFRPGLERLQQDLAVNLQRKLASDADYTPASRKGMLPWEVPDCRSRAAAVLQAHNFANRPSTVPSVVNKALRAMGHIRIGEQ